MNSINHHFETGAQIHCGYVDTLAEYLEQVRRFGKSSFPARQAMKKIRGYLAVKSDSDDRFYRRHYRYEGPSPYYNHNPLLQGRRAK
jgi:hypothetical protein